ncbi:MAG: ABC transporter permease [Defluviitaleaceae bacterium]|nr:ABC transporter permease [Defluviitaleaceae bacterium]
MYKMVKAECLMLYGELKQYYMNYVFYNIGLLIIFMGIFYSFSDSDNGMALGMLYALVMWQLCMAALSYLPNVIQDEALMGTLEQISMTRTSIFKVLISKVIVSAIFDIVKASVLFFICLFLFNLQGLILEAGSINFLLIGIIIATFVTFYAFGLFFAGVALFYKRIHAIIQVISYALLFFTNITVSVDYLPAVIRIISNIVPISWAVRYINMILEGYHGQLNEIVMWYLVSSILFIMVGFIGFRVLLMRAKKLGKLAHY